MSKKVDNYLLSKIEVGQVKKGFHDLPAQGHTYGKAPKKDKEGAKQVLTSWETGTKTSNKEGGKNYVAMNREGIKNGCIDSKQITDFRKNHEIKVKVKEGHKPQVVTTQDQSKTFGIKNRPSTPIKDVVCNNFAHTEQQQKKQRDAVYKLLNSDKQRPSLEVSPKRQKQQANRKKEIESNNFKLSKFKNVPSKVKPLYQQNKP